MTWFCFPSSSQIVARSEIQELCVDTMCKSEHSGKNGECVYPS